MKKITSVLLSLTLAVSLFTPAAMAVQPDELTHSNIALLTEDGNSTENPGTGGSSTDPIEPVDDTTQTDPPTETPTQAPTEAPTDPPTEPPTEAPTEAPTDAPTEAPTEPSTNPTQPSTEPSTEPSTPPTTPTTPTTPSTPDIPIYTGIPSITKNPSGENVKEGGFAEFVARAAYCTDIIWHLKNPGGSIDVLAKDAWERFPGLVVTGLNTERLGLDHIPKELNEWRVLAEFVGRDGNVWSEAAVINVTNHELQAPTIDSQPADANLKAGEKVTLSVSAQSAETNTTLTYQWYRNTTSSNAGGRAILGATNATFSPDYIAGTTYYYCLVRSSTGTQNSAATKSRSAAVTYAPAEETSQPTTAPDVPSATLSPWVVATESVPPTTEPEALPSVPNGPTRSHTLLYIVLAVIAVIAILGAAAVIIIMKLYPRNEPGDEPMPQWEPDAPEEPKARPIPPRQPKKPAPRSEDFYDSFGKQDDQWDDLSDLGDLSIYLGDDFDDEEKK